MPIYEYECSKCGQTIEVIQKMSDPDLAKHPDCGGALTKLLSVPGFQIKESGALPEGRQHFSELQQAENTRKAKEKKKAPPIISTPSGKKSHK